MDATEEKQGIWKIRDAWFCVLTLVGLQFVILTWLRFAARNSPAFDHWWASPFGTGVIYLIQDALWVFVAIWFSRVNVIQDFLEPAGLRLSVSIFGWCSAWLAIFIVITGNFGASKGLTEPSGTQNFATYGTINLSRCYFILSAVLVAPFCEEVATRGFLFPAFRSRYNFVVTTTIIICFSAYFHWSTISHSLFTFGCLASLWILLCIVREKTRSLWDCLFCHAVYNLVVLHFWISAIVIVLLFLPIVMRHIYSKRQKNF
jgi:membrane protease YdiL (CAAX protease family)